VLGTPSREEIHAMNPNYTEFKFPAIRAHPWSKVFSKRLPPDAVDLVRGPGLQNSGCTPMHRKRFPERRLPAFCIGHAEALLAVSQCARHSAATGVWDPN
jgi:hypothetical protein